MDFTNIKYFQDNENKYIIEMEQKNESFWMMPGPTLAPSNTWYKSSVGRNTVTSIAIVEDYTPTGNETESWNADENDNGDITAYLIGTDLIISINGNHFMYANPNSYLAFGGNNSSTRYSKVTSFTGIEKLLTNKCVNMDRMFDGLFLLENLNVGHFITKRCTSMEALFNNCELIKELDVSNWDVSKVTNMYAMFADCTQITSLDVSKWDVSNVINANSLCYDCFKLVDIDLSNLDWQNAENIGMSFYCCYVLPNITLKRTGGKTPSVWQAPLSDCHSLVSCDCSNINTEGITDLSYFFEGDTNLQEVIWHNMDFSTVTSFYSFFSGCNLLRQVDFTGIKPNFNSAGRNIFPTTPENIDVYVGTEEEKTIIENYLALNATNVTIIIGEMPALS